MNINNIYTSKINLATQFHAVTSFEGWPLLPHMKAGLIPTNADHIKRPGAGKGHSEDCSGNFSD